ncbi:permease-like cell division protein FtsX, partial [Streptomonospora salina]
RQYWNERVTLTIYMCTEISNSTTCEENGPATDQQRQDIQSDLESMDQVQSVEYVSAEQAFKDFQDRFANNQAMIDAVRKGDLPDNFRVQLADPSKYQAVANDMQGREGIDTIYDDQQVLEQFFGLLDGLTTAALTVSFVQLAAAALLIGNTVRLAAYNRRKETGIMRLVGASNFYIQLPFLLEGAIAGLIGGIIASGFIVAARFLLLTRIQEWFQFDVTLSTGSLLSVIGVSIILGVLLCTVASFLTLRRYLRV